MLYHTIIAIWKDSKHNDGLCGYRSNGASNGGTLAECNERAGERFQCSQHCGARVHIGKLLQSRFFKRIILRFHFVDDLVSPLCVSFRAVWHILAYVLAVSRRCWHAQRFLRAFCCFTLFGAFQV